MISTHFQPIKKSTFRLLRHIFVVIIFCSSINIVAQSTTQSDQGIFEFDSEIIDYGTIAANSDGVRTFTFTNVGTAPIIIASIKTSCGCTVPTKPKKPVLPGETGEIGVKYATNRIGTFSKTITVISNASEGNKLLKIKGKVEKGKISSL
tara:strand:+ start:114007 stop:114456 length:450 start_codon:yes stop_codon:yes gene_type:complete